MCNGTYAYRSICVLQSAEKIPDITNAHSLCFDPVNLSNVFHSVFSPLLWWQTVPTRFIYLSYDLIEGLIYMYALNFNFNAKPGGTVDPWRIISGKLWQPCLPMCHIAADTEVNRSWHLSQMLELASKQAHISVHLWLSVICHPAGARELSSVISVNMCARHWCHQSCGNKKKSRW